jgi:hypothetical protein
MIPAPLAYKFVVSVVMLAEVTFCARQLQLPVDLPIKQQDIRMQFIPHPRVIGFAGRIDIGDYSFSFAKSGRLRFITSLKDDRGNSPLPEYLERLSRINSSIDTSGAYRIATNWLMAIDIDLQRLEREKPVKVEQQFFISTLDGGRTNVHVPLPLFSLQWGDWRQVRPGWGDMEAPAIRITISGTNGGLLILRQENDSYSKRP